MTQRHQTPQGLEQPLGTSNGKGKLVNGDNQIEKLIINSLRPCGSMNPFQQELDFTATVPFKLNIARTQGAARAHVQRISKYFEKEDRAKIPNKTLTFKKEGGVLFMSGKWINLETDRASDFDVPIDKGGK